MSFVHVRHEIPSLLKETQEDGQRVYLTPDGKRYPSVTTVIADHNKKGIDQWRKRVGDKNADRISKIATDRGDMVHEALEALLMNYSTLDYMKKMTPYAKAVFVNMKKEVVQRISEVHGIEQTLYSHKIRLAGTADCVAVYDGKLSIVDFKTSLKLKKKAWVYGYFMQLTAYAFMFQELTGLEIEQGVILIGVDNCNFAQTFRLPRSEFTPYFKDLLSYRDKYVERIAA